MKENNQELLNDYLEYLIYERMLDEKSREVYLREAASLLCYIESNNLEVEKLSVTNLEEFLLKRSKSLENSTKAKINSALRSFFKYLHIEEIRDDNPALLLEKSRRSDTLPHTLDISQVDHLLDRFKNDEYDQLLAFRDYAFFEVIYSCGLRISEAISLKLSAYNRDEKTIKVIGKRDKERIVFLGERASQVLDEYILNIRPRLKSKCSNKKDKKAKLSDDIIFLSSKGLMLTRQGMHKRFHAITKREGIEATVHTLRHSFASHLLQNGANIREVQTLLGHADIKTTQIYTHLNTDNLLSLFDKYSALSDDE